MWYPKFKMILNIHLGLILSLTLLLLVEGGMSKQHRHESQNLKFSNDISNVLELRSEDKAKKPSAQPAASGGCPAVKPSTNTVEVPPPSLANASWIWTSEVQPQAPGGTVPPAARPFLKVLHTKCPVDHVTIDITCDNFYSLYVNGKIVGSGNTTFFPYIAQRYTVKFESTLQVTIAVWAAQDPATKGGVGLLASGVAWNSKEVKPIETSFNTDSTWKTFPADDFDKKFIKVGFDDSRWNNALALGVNGVAPWGTVAGPTSPTRSSPPLSGISGLPDAPSAPTANVVTLAGKSS